MTTLCKYTLVKNKYMFILNSNFYFNILWEAYEVGWDFVIALEQQKWQQPQPKSAALHTGKDPKCYAYLFPPCLNSAIINTVHTMCLQKYFTFKYWTL